MVKNEKEFYSIVERIEELLSVRENIENPDAQAKIRMHNLGFTQMHFNTFSGVSHRELAITLMGKANLTLMVPEIFAGHWILKLSYHSSYFLFCQAIKFENC